MPPELRQAVTDTIEAAPPPRRVEEVKAMLESTEKGGVRNSIETDGKLFIVQSKH